MRLAGTALASVLLASIGLLLAAMSGASPLRVPGFPDGSPAANADATTAPPASPSADPRDGGGTAAAQPTPSTPTTTTSPTSRRRVPTHTPTHAKPSKSH